MSNSREIKSKITSVQNTQKITGAMELVAASKMRSARNKMDMTRPYSNYAQVIIQHTQSAHLEYRHHPYLQVRPVNKLAMIIVSTNRGLCGGLNINLFKLVLNKIEALKKQKIEVELCIIGTKAADLFKRIEGIKITAINEMTMEKNPKVLDVLGLVSACLESYDNGMVDEVLLFSNDFINTIKQKPYCKKILPIGGFDVQPQKKNDSGETNVYWDYLYEPDPKAVLTLLFKKYIESQVYRAVVENIACEQAARMLAMKNATDNAADIIDTLKLDYNKARQALITQELAEIVSGAASV